jgi:DNA modification methylase
MNIDRRIDVYNEDCLFGMNRIVDRSVDLILCDLPYGTTKCAWDIIIPFEPLWKQYKRIIKDNGAIILFGSEPFSSHLRLSNLSWYKYDLYWKKEKPTNFFQLKKRFGKCTETISIFYKNQPTYNPQKVKHNGKLIKNSPKGNHNSIVSGISKKVFAYQDDGYRYPNDILEFRREILGTTIHPTQKPLELIKYLIQSFSKENDLVVDNCFGSGTTPIACLETNRNFVGFEWNPDHPHDLNYNNAIKRIDIWKQNKKNIFDLLY